MKEYRNVFGELEYELGDFFVEHHTYGDGKYRILKHEPWYVTDAYQTYLDFMWPIPKFDSWIKAVRFLKENIKDLR